MGEIVKNPHNEILLLSQQRDTSRIFIQNINIIQRLMVAGAVCVRNVLKSVNDHFWFNLSRPSTPVAVSTVERLNQLGIKEMAVLSGDHDKAVRGVADAVRS
jgi:cation transport ATPase